MDILIIYKCDLCDYKTELKENHQNHIISNEHKEKYNVKKNEFINEYDDSKIEELLNNMSNIEEQPNMMSKGSWFSFLHSLHNILRDGQSKLTGMPALNEITNILTVKFLGNTLPEGIRFTDLEIFCTDEKIEEDSMNSGKKQNYRYLFDIYKTNDVSSLRFIINRIQIDNLKICALTDNNAMDLQLMINYIGKTFEKIDLKNFDFDAFGEAYEKFKADEVGNAGKRTGQYFTNRQVVNFIIKELKITSKDICYDPACGTGGFLHKICKKVEYKNEEELKNFKNNLYGNEILSEVYKALSFNMLINKISLNNIRNQDSLHEANCKRMENKCTKILANPPFGMGFKITYKYEKLKRPSGLSKQKYIEWKKEQDEKEKDYYWYPLKQGKTTIKASAGLFALHFYRSLKDGGQAGFVIERGIINNGTELGKNCWEKRLRQFLLERCNIYKIVLLPKGIFSHTSFDTCIIFWIKGVKTTKVQYDEGYFKEEDKGTSNKKMHIRENIKTLYIKDIIKKEYSLKLDDYEEKKEIDSEFETVLLKDISIMKNGTNLAISDIVHGEYPVIGGGKKPIGFHNNFNCDEDTILISKSGSAGYVSKYKNKVWASDCFSIKINNTLFENDYIWYILKFMQYILYNKKHGSAIPHFYIKNMVDVRIAKISKKHQQEIIDYIKKNINDIDNFIKIFKKYELFTILLKERYDLFDKIIAYYKQIPIIEEQIKFAKLMKKTEIELLFESADGEYMKLNDIVDIEYGTRITKKDNSIKQSEDYKYPVYGGGDITFYTNKYNRSGETLILSRFGVSPKCVRIIKGNIFLNDSALTFTMKLGEYEKYFNTYMSNNQKKIFNLVKGNAQKNMDIYKLKNMKIKIPSIEKQNEIVEKIEQINSSLSIHNKMIQIENIKLEYINKHIETICKIVQPKKPIEKPIVEI